MIPKVICSYCKSFNFGFKNGDINVSTLHVKRHLAENCEGIRSFKPDQSCNYNTSRAFVTRTLKRYF